MNTKIIGKNVKVTEGIENKINEKLDKLQRYEIIKNAQCNVLIRTVKDDQIIEVTMILENKKIIRCEKRANNLYTAIDMIEEPLDRQCRKLKEKMSKKERVKHQEKMVEVKKEPVVKSKTIPVFQMSLEEAIDEMEALDHDFHLFIDEKTGMIATVYRRKEHGYGVLYTSEE